MPLTRGQITFNRRGCSVWPLTFAWEHESDGSRDAGAEDLEGCLSTGPKSTKGQKAGKEHTSEDAPRFKTYALYPWAGGRGGAYASF